MRLLTIYKKELIETLRDRRTLLFMLLLPTVLTPLVIFGATRLAVSLQRKQAVETVRIVADAESRRAWEELVHAWFLDSELGKGVQAMQSPLLRAIVRPERLAELDQVPAAVARDPGAFAGWTRELAGAARREIESAEERLGKSSAAIPDDVREKAMEFYTVALKGLGMIEFVDPADLDAPPAGW